MKLLGRDLRELLVEGDHHQLLDPEAVDHVALHLEGHDQLRRRLGMDHLERVRVEGEHGVGVVDHRLVAEVDAVEDPDRDVAVARLGVGQLGDLDAHVRTTSGLQILPSSARDCDQASLRGSAGPAAHPAPPSDRAGRATRASASSSSSSRSGRKLISSSTRISAASPSGTLKGPIAVRRRATRSRRPRGSRSACGCRCPTSTRSRRWRGPRPLSSSSARWTVTVRVGRLDRLAAVGLLVEALAVHLDRGGHRHPLLDLAGGQLERSRGRGRSRSARRRGRRCVRAPAEPRRGDGRSWAAPSRKRCSRVALPSRTISSPVANGSSVPAWPAFPPRSRRTARDDVMRGDPGRLVEQQGCRQAWEC